MSREIKFRFWDKKDGAMIDWQTVRQTAFNRGDIHLCYHLMGTNPNFIKMQFTGLEDKTVTEIYESDIVEIISNGVRSQYEVKWDMNSAGFYLIELKREGDKYGPYTRNIGLREDKYVIGNIYSTPQLITK